VLEPNDMISVPRGENRSFRNIGDETGRLLVMIVPETAEQVDPIAYAPSLAREIESEYGKKALEGLQTIGFKFEEPVG
jgi:oxalate decarboxylase/phosphoglucose isomerase-like protein (cupin superfamily)